MADFAFVKVLLEEITKTEFLKCSDEASKEVLEIYRMFSIIQDFAGCLLEKVETVNPKELQWIKVKVNTEEIHAVPPIRVAQLKTEKFDEDCLESFPKPEIKKEEVDDDLIKLEDYFNDKRVKDDISQEKHNHIDEIQGRLKSSLFLKNEKRCVDSRRRLVVPPKSSQVLFPCDFCERKFPSEKVLQKHFVTLHQKLYR